MTYDFEKFLQYSCNRNKKTLTILVSVSFCGSSCWARTSDPLINSQML